MTHTKNSIALILIALLFTITTCTTDNSITGNSDQTLGKTAGIVDINRPAGEDDREDDERKCFSTTSDFVHNLSVCEPPNNLSLQYDFRDNYLLKSEKGKDYTKYYYALSKYGIENNLVNKYYKEHYELLKNSVEIAYDLQHGSNTGQILINKKTADDLKDMLKVYRGSPNYKEIEPVLEYLEMDLVKYENQPKYKIAADFK